MKKLLCCSQIDAEFTIAPAFLQHNPVMVPMGDWAKSRLKKLSETDKRRDNSRVGSGFGKNISNWLGRTMAYPSNVLHLATESSNKQHSAVFPEELPTWFIKLFTQPHDVVLDPFLGSGTTCIAAATLERKSIGIEIKEDYYNLARENIEKRFTHPQKKQPMQPLSTYAELNLSGSI